MLLVLQCALQHDGLPAMMPVREGSAEACITAGGTGISSKQCELVLSKMRVVKPTANTQSLVSLVDSSSANAQAGKPVSVSRCSCPAQGQLRHSQCLICS